MMIVYSTDSSERLTYSLELILGRMMGMRYTLTGEYKKLRNVREPVLNYSTWEIPGSFTVHPHTLLFEQDVRDQKIHRVNEWENLPVFFETGSKDFPFDLFAAVFYLVSRYEEYLSFVPDRHNRFPASASLAFRHNFLSIPVVNKWINMFRQKIFQYFPDIRMNEFKFDFIPTLDIDHAWAFRNRSLYRITGALVKDIFKANFDHVKFRLNVLRGKTDDPFFTIPSWDSIHEGLAGKLKVFILAGTETHHDSIISVNNSTWREMVKILSRKYQIGLHPSYISLLNVHEAEKEKKLLEKLTEQQVYISRQHYIRLSFPHTYRYLIKMGIKEDYSMGYPDQPGFRAGIASPFPFFDLGNNRVSGLMVYPFCVMDRTLKDYLGLSPSQASECIQGIILNLKTTGGLFISVWHNDSLGNYGEWAGWKEVYIKMIEECKNQV